MDKVKANMLNMRDFVKVGDRLRYKFESPLVFIVYAVIEDYCLTYIQGRDRRDNRSITRYDYRKNFRKETEHD